MCHIAAFKTVSTRLDAPWFISTTDVALCAPVGSQNIISEHDDGQHGKEDSEGEWWCTSCSDLQLVNNELWRQIADLRGELNDLKTEHSQLKRKVEALENESKLKPKVIENEKTRQPRKRGRPPMVICTNEVSKLACIGDCVTYVPDVG